MENLIVFRGDFLELLAVPHYGTTCSCGQALLCKLDWSQLRRAKLGPVEGLRALVDHDQVSLRGFEAEHRGRGHKPEIVLCALIPFESLGDGTLAPAMVTRAQPGGVH